MTPDRDHPDRLGVMLTVCAPSGAGKTTLVKRLLEEFPRLAYSVSCTTRPPRPGEQHGRDYHFLNAAEFELLKEKDHFAEWAEVHGACYGTPVKEIEERMAAGRDVLLDVDVQGVKQLKKSLKNQGLYVFILPPCLRKLEERLRNRGSEQEEAIQLRLKNARVEICEAPLFDTWVVNDDLEQAYAELRAAYVHATLAPSRHPELLASILKDWES